MLSVMISPLRSLIFLVLLLPAVTPFAGIDSAWSGPEPIKEIRVLSNVTVNHKDVSLAEICDPETLPGEWKSIMDGLNIGDAPQAGLEKFIDPGQLDIPGEAARFLQDQFFGGKVRSSRQNRGQA